MRLMQYQDVNLSRDDTVFKTPYLPKLIVAIICLAGAIAFITPAIARRSFSFPAIVGGGIFGVIALILFNVCKKCRSPQNWLVTADFDALNIQLRSFMNSSSEPRPVVRVEYKEIQSARLTRMTIKFIKKGTKKHSNGNTTVSKTLKCLDISLASGTLTELRSALDYEFSLQYDGFSCHTYPVFSPDDKTIRLNWEGTSPKIKQMLDLLQRENITIEPDSAEKHDYRKLKDLPDEEIKQKLKELIRYGQKFEIGDIVGYINDRRLSKPEIMTDEL